MNRVITSSLLVCTLLVIKADAAPGGFDLSMQSSRDLATYRDGRWTTLSLMEDMIRRLLFAVRHEKPFLVLVYRLNREIRSFDLSFLMAQRYVIPNMDKLKENPTEEAPRVIKQMEDERILISFADAFNTKSSSSAVDVFGSKAREVVKDFLASGSSPIIPQSEKVAGFYEDVLDDLEDLRLSGDDQVAKYRALKSLDNKIKETVRQYDDVLRIIKPKDVDRLVELAKENNFEEAEKIALRAYISATEAIGSTVYAICEIVRRTGRE